eukprot:12884187-Prorocentrum_lima.AAC.1
MVGIIKEQLMKVLHGSNVNEQYWPYPAMYVADVMRHRATHRLWTLPAFGKVVAITRTHILTVDTKGRPQVKH